MHIQANEELHKQKDHPHIHTCIYAYIGKRGAAQQKDQCDISTSVYIYTSIYIYIHIQTPTFSYLYMHIQANEELYKQKKQDV